VSDPFVVIMNNNISLNQPEHQRASTGKSNKSTSFGKQYIKEDQQESQINQQPLETSTPKSINRKGK
jgi:hypothetical protein